jgi:hypothetical protein
VLFGLIFGALAWTASVGALVSFARTGVFAPEGVFALGAPALYETWQAIAAIALLRGPRVTSPS